MIENLYGFSLFNFLLFVLLLSLILFAANAVLVILMLLRSNGCC